MFLKALFFIQISLLLLITLAKGFQPREVTPAVGSSTSRATFEEQNRQRLDSGTLLKKDKVLSPSQSSANDDNGLIEVKEDEIPEGSTVYVLEEEEDQPVDGEILKTANNIVFRPLFRYRGKQEAQRRNSNRIRRRYFIPKRSYRETYRYPYYYGHRYY